MVAQLSCSDKWDAGQAVCSVRVFMDKWTKSNVSSTVGKKSTSEIYLAIPRSGRSDQGPRCSGSVSCGRWRDDRLDELHRLFPTHDCFKGGHADVVSALLESGAIIDYQLRTGFTALQTACSNGHLAVVKASVGRLIWRITMVKARC